MKRLLRGLLVLGVFLGGTRTEGARAACQLGKQGTQGKELVPSLIEDLRSKYIGVRSSAAVSLGELGPDAKEAIPALIDALRDKEEVHDRAVYALGKIGSAGLPLLIQALGDKGARVRAGIAEALGDMGQGAKPAASALLKVSTDPDPHVREQIAWALGHLQDKVCIPALIERLKTDPNADVRRAAAWALGQFSPPAREAIPPLIQALRDPDDFSARQKLGQRPTMSGLLNSRGVQEFAHESLAKIGSAAVPAVLDLLKDPDRKQQRNAVWILGTMGSEAQVAVPALIE
jgi:HEAT repeat protein